MQVWTAVSALAIASSLGGALRSEAKAHNQQTGNVPLDEELIITAAFAEHALTVTASTNLDASEQADDSVATLLPFQACCHTLM
jgi:Tfp pilus assembly protein PilN